MDNHDRGRFEGEVITRLDYLTKLVEDTNVKLTVYETRLRAAEQAIASLRTLGPVGLLLTGTVGGIIGHLFLN